MKRKKKKHLLVLLFQVVYPISDAVYPDVTIVLVIQRRILYYVLNIMFPCFWLNILSVLTFCLPVDSGEKITLSITVLLSYSVFMLLVADTMPPTSEAVPLIGEYSKRLACNYWFSCGYLIIWPFLLVHVCYLRVLFVTSFPPHASQPPYMAVTLLLLPILSSPQNRQFLSQS